MNLEKIRSASWKDCFGNVMIITDHLPGEIQLTKGIYLCIDGNDCSEGMIEQVVLEKEDILSALEDYGYLDMMQKFSKWWKENQEVE
ncbi:MAG: hypothetical protein KHZ62_07170 [Clostridiales bacterium]|nr:hypothetical protein [Clostridiales bacterium]